MILNAYIQKIIQAFIKVQLQCKIYPISPPSRSEYDAIKTSTVMSFQMYTRSPEFLEAGPPRSLNPSRVTGGKTRPVQSHHLTLWQLFNIPHPSSNSFLSSTLTKQRNIVGNFATASNSPRRHWLHTRFYVDLSAAAVCVCVYISNRTEDLLEFGRRYLCQATCYLPVTSFKLSTKFSTLLAMVGKLILGGELQPWWLPWI